MSFRPRYEWADEDAFSLEARGLTLRTLAGWRTRPYHGVEARVLLGSSVQLIDAFNDGLNGKTQYPYSNTPEKTDFTEAYVRWRGVDGLTVTAGRQKLDLDRTRFVGPNEFRQTQRWYNGASATPQSATAHRACGIPGGRRSAQRLDRRHQGLADGVLSHLLNSGARKQ